MKLKQSKVFKAGIGYTIGNVMVKGINFLAIPIFSRLLTTEEMGLYTVFAAYEAVLFVFIGMALHSSIRSAKYEFEGKIDDFTSSIMGIYWINLIVALFISIVFNKILTKLLDLDLVTLVMLVIYSFGIAVVTLYNARISLDYEYKKYIKVSLASTIGNVGLSLILIKTIFNSSRGFGRVLGITISTVLVTVYIIYDLYKRARPTFRKKYWKFGIKYSLPIIPHGISQVLLAQFDRIMINKMIGKSEAGIYGLVGNIKLILAIISDSISEVWMTWFYEKMKNKLQVRICDKEWNTDRLADKVVTEHGDFAAYYAVNLEENGEGISSIPVTVSLMNEWGVSAEQIQADAMVADRKRGVTLMDMNEIIKSMIFGEEPENLLNEKMDMEAMENPMFCLTNKAKMNGASLLLQEDIRKQIGECLGSDYFVIPSSVHEVLILPDNGIFQVPELNAMVQEVNETQVERQEQLSDKVQFCDKKTAVMENAERREARLEKEKAEVKGGIHGRLEKAKAEIKAKEADKVPKNKSKELATAL